MRRQFIWLQHCRRSVSWQKGAGFFERTPDMAWNGFLLEKRARPGSVPRFVFGKFSLQKPDFFRPSARRTFFIV